MFTYDACGNYIVFMKKKTEKDLGGKHIEITGNFIFIKVWQPCNPVQLMVMDSNYFLIHIPKIY